MCTGSHDDPRVGTPHSNGSPFTGLYDRGPINLAMTVAATTSTMAVINTVINNIKYIYVVIIIIFALVKALQS